MDYSVSLAVVMSRLVCIMGKLLGMRVSIQNYRVPEASVPSGSTRDMEYEKRARDQTDMQ